MTELSRHLDQHSGLWGMTAYFNPIGYRRRLDNYRLFRAHLSIPLVTVELGLDGHYDLGEADADILIRCDACDILWQRERMLNLALAAVPGDCDKIARLDCDVIFEDPSWSIRASRELDDHVFVQLFTEAYDQPRGAIPGMPGFPDHARAWEGFANLWRSKQNPALIDRRIQAAGTRSRCAMGMAWAFRRELHADVDIYDTCILGGAEHAMLAAACGLPDIVVDYQRMGAGRSRNYLDWAARFHRLVDGTFGVVQGRIAHLWHGDIEHRGYATRYKDFAIFDFDPVRDLAINESGAWRWASHDVKMRNYVRDYFASRREDG
ncbi:MAG: hypothetical protein ACKO6B_14055 [Planctomycetia bacterium]